MSLTIVVTRHGTGFAKKLKDFRACAPKGLCQEQSEEAINLTCWCTKERNLADHLGRISLRQFEPKALRSQLTAILRLTTHMACSTRRQSSPAWTGASSEADATTPHVRGQKTCPACICLSRSAWRNNS